MTCYWRSIMACASTYTYIHTYTLTHSRIHTDQVNDLLLTGIMACASTYTYIHTTQTQLNKKNAAPKKANQAPVLNVRPKYENATVNQQRKLIKVVSQSGLPSSRLVQGHESAQRLSLRHETGRYDACVRAWARICAWIKTLGGTHRGTGRHRWVSYTSK